MKVFLNRGQVTKHLIRSGKHTRSFFRRTVSAADKKPKFAGAVARPTITAVGT